MGIILPWKIDQLGENNKSGFFRFLNLDRGVCGVVSLHHLFMSNEKDLSSFSRDTHVHDK